MDIDKYTTRTVTIRLNASEADVKAVHKTCSEVNALYADVVAACNSRKCVNYFNMATPESYTAFRSVHPAIPSMLVQQIIKEACTNTKRWNSTHKNHPWSYPGIRQKQSYPLNKRTISYRGGLITFSTCAERVRVLADLPEWFSNKYDVSMSDLQSATVKLKGTSLVLCISFRIPISTCDCNNVVGIDRGLYNLCTLSDGIIISSKRAVAVKRRYQHLRLKLQQKGTRSAKRHLKKMSGREKRFMSDFNHCVTKQLASRKDVGTYVLEDLRGIRKQRKGKKLNSWLSNWSYYQFEQQLTYKCDLNGINVAFIDPRYTSQKCSCCGEIDKLSRTQSRYACTTCGHTEHADVNAAKNIRDNYVRFKAKQGAQPSNRDSTAC